ATLATGKVAGLLGVVSRIGGVATFGAMLSAWIQRLAEANLGAKTLRSTLEDLDSAGASGFAKWEAIARRLNDGTWGAATAAQALHYWWTKPKTSGMSADDAPRDIRLPFIERAPEPPAVPPYVPPGSDDG